MRCWCPPGGAGCGEYARTPTVKKTVVGVWFTRIRGKVLHMVRMQLPGQNRGTGTRRDASDCDLSRASWWGRQYAWRRPSQGQAHFDWQDSRRIRRTPRRTNLLIDVRGVGYLCIVRTGPDGHALPGVGESCPVHRSLVAKPHAAFGYYRPGGKRMHRLTDLCSRGGGESVLGHYGRAWARRGSAVANCAFWRLETQGQSGKGVRPKIAQALWCLISRKKKKNKKKKKKKWTGPPA